MEGAGPTLFRVAAATHAHLLLQPQAASHKHALAIVNSLFHTALETYTSTVPPLQCAAVATLSSAASPSVHSIVSQSLSLGDVIKLVPDLPASVAASAARLAAASAVDASSCAKLVDMRADEIITSACAANPKSKELREAAGAPLHSVFIAGNPCDAAVVCRGTHAAHERACQGQLRHHPHAPRPAPHSRPL
jgi:hypothetical protein